MMSYTLRFSFVFPFLLVLFQHCLLRLSETTAWCSWICHLVREYILVLYGLDKYWLMKSMHVRLGRAKVKSIGRLSCLFLAMRMIQFHLEHFLLERWNFISIALYLVTTMSNYSILSQRNILFRLLCAC